MLENRADLYVNECQKIRHYRARTTEERRKRRMPHCERRIMPNRDFFTLRGAYVKMCFIAMLYTLSIVNQP